MALTELRLMGHLFRRAGFGATREELEQAVGRGYEATVELILHPEVVPAVEEDVLQRYYIDAKESFQLDSAQIAWVFRMINTRRPLEEKMALFWHGLFATGFNKCDDPRNVTIHGSWLSRSQCSAAMGSATSASCSSSCPGIPP